MSHRSLLNAMEVFLMLYLMLANSLDQLVPGLILRV